MPARIVAFEDASHKKTNSGQLEWPQRSSWSMGFLNRFGRGGKATSPTLDDDTTPTVRNLNPWLNTHYVELASRILAIINRYKLPANDGESGKYAATAMDLICTKIAHSEPILMCLPAFPFKSPNTSSKVLGALPDKAEEFALAHLNGMCAAISHIYEHGARLVIISDGLVYNDLLGVPDSAVWQYRKNLLAIAAEKGYKHIMFSSLQDLTKTNTTGEMNLMQYVCNTTNLRHALLSQYGDAEFDASVKVLQDENVCTTYRGYIKFLSTDLQDVYPVGSDRTKSQFKKGVEYIAKKMLFRGDAFARAVRSNFPDYIRLSIHLSNNENKISIGVLPSDSPFTTPWHCTIAFKLDGTITTGHHAQFAADDKYELVHENGRPSFYRERTDLLSWGEQGGGISCEPLYPAGIMLRPAKGTNTLSIEDVDGSKVRALAQINSPVILRGFAKTRDLDLFVKKAHDLGTPTGWKFGLVLEVKDRGEDSGGLNNVLSAEWMPFHYDGLFKTQKKIHPDGTEQLVSTPPGFQFFSNHDISPGDTGHTIFSTSTMIFHYLTREVPLEYLRSLTWSVSTSSFDSTILRGLPLVVDHAVTAQPCLRFHEPWPQSRTRFQPTDVEIENAGECQWDSAAICAKLTDLLHDRRVAYYHSWQKGDLLVSDNVLTHHTRSSFDPGCKRELWRINFD